MHEKWLTTRQAAEVLGMPYTTLRDMVTKRLVQHRRVGKHVRFAPEDMAAIKQQAFEPAITATPSRATARIRAPRVPRQRAAA